jgi:hypothetical protein
VTCAVTGTLAVLGIVVPVRTYLPLHNSNVFNTQDEEWHTKYMRPIRPFWTVTKVLDMEPVIDETLEKFISKMESKFVNNASANKVCKGYEWLGFCNSSSQRLQ